MLTRTDEVRVANSPVTLIGTDDVRKRMGEILDCVNLRGDEFLIERKHKPMAVLIPVQKPKILAKMVQRFLLESLTHKGSELTQE